jgi:thiamine-phosphate pyrophosphorylase
MDRDETPAAQIYLLIGADTAPDDLAAALEALAPACLLIRGGGLTSSEFRKAAKPLIALAQAQDVAALIEDDAALATTLGCDGVHLNDPKAYKAARKTLGPEAIVGAACSGSRHEAMTLADGGADYVAFGALEPPPTSDPEVAELIAWWQALMTVPCVALGAGDAETARALIRAGADFLAAGPDLARELSVEMAGK